MRKSYLLNSVARFNKPDDQGVDPEITHKAQVEAERAKVVVTKVDVKDDVEEENDDEQKEEDGEKEIEDKGDEDSGKGEDDTDGKDDVSDKEVLKADKKVKRLEKQYERTSKKLADAAKKISDLEAKLAANPDKVLTEEDVETLSEQKANEKQLIKEFAQTSNRLADDAQKHLKLKDKEFNALVAEALEELDINGVPGEIVGALGDIDNGGIILAHMLKNVDVMEEFVLLKGRPVKLGVELAKLSTKLATPPKKKISQVPDAIEPIGGKAATTDRLNLLMTKKNKSQDEMNEYVQLRNAQVQQARMNGRHNLR